MRCSWIAAGCFAATLVGCGPAPYTLGPDEPSAAEPAAGAQSAQSSPQRDPEDRWIPDGLPRPNPFDDHHRWVGEYECAQGWTHLALRVLDVHGPRVRAVFAFHHADSGTQGEFLLAGRFDETTGRVALRPGEWLQQPEGYVTVGMVGNVSPDGKRFTGRILGPGCKSFGLHSN